MKKPALTAAIHRKSPAVRDSEIHPTLQLWPLQTPSLNGEKFSSPVAEIPTQKTPLPATRTV